MVYGRPVLSVEFAPNGLSLASESNDGSIRIWNVADGICTQILRDERLDCIFSVAFSPDGATLASAGFLGIQNEEDEWDHFGAIVLWDLLHEDTTTGSKLLFQSQEINSMIMSIAYSPNGQYLATGSVDSKVRSWNVADSSLQTAFKGHIYFIQSVCFSPNGKILASASHDGSVRLLDVDARDGDCLVILSGHDNVKSRVFSPCGRTLASGSSDGGRLGGTVRLWNPFDDSKRDKNVDWAGFFRRHSLSLFNSIQKVPTWIERLNFPSAWCGPKSNRFL
jgi:WD40 repeat protein